MTGVAALLSLAARRPKDLTRTDDTGENFFGKVIEMIDELVVTLQEEGESDLKAKTECEDERTALSESARDHSTAMDQNNDRIDNNNELIQTNEDTIEQAKEEIAQIREDLKKMKELREEENAQYIQDDKDNKMSMEVLKIAYEILQKFYKDHDLPNADLNTGLMQMTQNPLSIADPPTITAGAAPPPPPVKPSESGKYGGSAWGGGIMGALQTLYSGLKYDADKQTKQEEKAQAEYDKTKAAYEKAIEDRDALILELETSNDKMRTDNGRYKDENKGSGDQLKNKKDQYHNIEKGCNFIQSTFDQRVAARNQEIDGLKKAKAILNGAMFNIDPNREMNVDDAFLQGAC